MVAGCAGLLLAPNLGWAKDPPTEVGGPGSGVAGVLALRFFRWGRGSAAVIRTAKNHADFVDDGSSTISDLGDALVIPWLRAQGCGNVDRIILSHGDFDHISSTTELFEQFREPTVFTSPHFARHAVGNFPAEAMLRELKEAGKSPSIIHRGDHVDLGDGAGIDVLWPPVDSR